MSPLAERLGRSYPLPVRNPFTVVWHTGGESTFGPAVTTIGGMFMVDYSKSSNEELYRFLEERAPDVAVVVGEVRDSNRETIIAFLTILSGLWERQ